MTIHFDHVLKQLGQFGKYQRFMFFFVGMVAVPSTLPSVLIVFIGMKTNFRCGTSNVTNTSDQWTNSCNGSILDEGGCDNLVYDHSVFSSTIRSQWDLVCDRDYMVALVQTLFMAGWLVGVVITGYLSDRFGRRRVLLSCIVTLSVCSLVAAYIPEYIVYVVLRFLCGALSGSVFTIGFVIVIEMVGYKSRSFIAVWYNGFWSLGIMILSGLAYLIRDHQLLQIAVGVVVLFYFIYFWTLPESPRWLLTVNRVQEAEIVINKMAKVNGKKLDVTTTGLTCKNDANTTQTTSGNLLDLLKTPNLCRVTCFACFNWFVVSFVYFGVTLSGASLGGDVFLNVFLSGLVELPGLFLIRLLVDRLGRVRLLALSNVIGGLSCLGAALLMGIPELNWLLVTLAMIGKSAFIGSFAILYLYSSEVYPTVVRNAGLGLCSMCARIGSLIAPQVGRLGYIWTILPFLVFAVMPIISGLLALLMPETLGSTLPETLEEGEQFASNVNLCCSKKGIVKDEDVKDEHELSSLYDDEKCGSEI